MSQDPHLVSSTPEDKRINVVGQVDREFSTDSALNIGLLSYHEHNAGRLIIDPEYVDFAR